MLFNQHEKVRILKYPEGDINEFGFIQGFNDDKRYWVSNMNMPFQGTVSEIFDETELDKVNG